VVVEQEEQEEEQGPPRRAAAAVQAPCRPRFGIAPREARREAAGPWELVVSVHRTVEVEVEGTSGEAVEVELWTAICASLLLPQAAEVGEVGLRSSDSFPD
jgi:hypothetical protein